MIRIVLALLAPVLLSSMVWAVLPDPVFPDVEALSSTPLSAKIINSYEKEGIVIEEVMYHSEMDGEKSVDIFGYFGYPKGGKNLPAIIWNQGGLYPATDYWVICGAKHGFAVLCIDFPIEGEGYRSTAGYPINADLTIGDDPAKSPIARGVVALLKGVTFLESRPEVDRTRLGMAGSSWGGFFTTLMVGIDVRLKAGSCFFGTGSLQLGNVWVPYPDKDPVWKERWAKTLDPAWRLAHVKTPMNWCTGTNDFAYWMPALMNTVSTAAGETHLALKANFDHALTPNLDDEVFGFLGTKLNGKPAFPTLSPVKVVRSGKKLLATWSFDSPAERKITSADLILSYGAKDNWHSRQWLTLPATIKGRMCTAVLPKSAVPYWISGAVTDTDTYRHSTPLRFVDLRSFKFLDAKALPKVDGCAEWGDFEKKQLECYVALNGYPTVTVSTVAHSGSQSAQLQGGANTFPPVHFVAGFPHRFTGFMKADQPTEVTVQLDGNFDEKQIPVTRTISVGTEWTPVTLDIKTEQGIITTIALTITAPMDRTVLLDSASFVLVK